MSQDHSSRKSKQKRADETRESIQPELNSPPRHRFPRQISLIQSIPLHSPARAKLKRTLEPRTTHGGSPSRGRRKMIRPFAPKVPLHIVLKSTRAKGLWSMNHRKNKLKILSMIYTYAERFKVHVYRSANVGNHIHLVVKAEERKHLADFLRVLAGRIAITVTGARKHKKQIGIPLQQRTGPRGKKLLRFWNDLCWSRLVNWGRDFYNVRNYVLANEIEALAPEHKEWVRRSGQDEANFFGWDFGGAG